MHILSAIRDGRRNGNIAKGSAKLKGYFRSVRFWFVKTKAGQYQLHAEVFTVLTTVNKHVGVPPTLILKRSPGPACKGKDGVVFEDLWTSREIHRSKFRSWFAKVLKYRPEWLTADDELLLAYNRVLKQVEISQYSLNGEFNKAATKLEAASQKGRQAR